MLSKLFVAVVNYRKNGYYSRRSQLTSSWQYFELVGPCALTKLYSWFVRNLKIQCMTI